MNASLQVLGLALGRHLQERLQACRLGQVVVMSAALDMLGPSLRGLRTTPADAAGEASALTSCEGASADAGPSASQHVRERHGAALGLPSHFAEPPPKPTPSTVRSWDDVPLQEDAKEPLKAASLGPHVGLALVRDLGYSSALDLALISDEQIQALRAAAPVLGSGPGGGPAAGGPAAGAAAAAGGGLKPLEIARLVAVCRAAREARVSPRSGSLQELADLLRVLNKAVVVDLGGLTFSGPLKPHTSGGGGSSGNSGGTGAAQQQLLRISGNNVTLVNGHLHLRPDQALQVTGRNVLLSDLTIEAARAVPSSFSASSSSASTSTNPNVATAGEAAGAAAAAAAAPAPSPQRVDIGLVSVLGGTARLTRCRLVNPCPHVALLVGGGARAELWHSEVAGSGGAGVLALGPGVVVAVHHCRVADTAGTCVHVGGGASAVLSSSELLRSGLFCGLVAQGPGSRVEAQRLVVDGATESNVFVEQGAGVLLQDSRLTHSVERQGLQARGRGSVAELQRCVLSGNGQSGAYVLSGAAVKLQGCTLQGNGISGLMAGGSGSRAQLAGCQLAANAGAGVHVVGGAEAELDGCEVTGAPADQPAPAPAISADGAAGEVPPPPPPLIRAQGEGSRVVVRATKCSGDVAALEGGIVDM